jgi:hypothetical protein
MKAAGTLGRRRCGRAAALLCAVWAAAAPATPILDQSYVVPGGLGGFLVHAEQSLAQVFTVGLGGTLAQVGVQLHQVGDMGDVRLAVHSAVDGVPTMEVLFSTTIPIAAIPLVLDPPVPLLLVDVSAARIGVAAGGQLAISLSRAFPPVDFGPQVLWTASAADLPLYAGGAAFTTFGAPLGTWRALSEVGIRTSFGFQTLVDRAVSAPGTLLLVAAGLVALAAARRADVRGRPQERGRTA